MCTRNVGSKNLPPFSLSRVSGSLRVMREQWELVRVEPEPMELYFSPAVYATPQLLFAVVRRGEPVLPLRPVVALPLLFCTKNLIIYYFTYW